MVFEFYHHLAIEHGLFAWGCSPYQWMYHHSCSGPKSQLPVVRTVVITHNNPTCTPPSVCVCENEQFPNHTPWPPDVSQIHGSLQPFGGLQRMATLVAINLPYGNGKHTTHRDADDLRFGDGEQQIISIHFHEIDLKQTG